MLNKLRFQLYNFLRKTQKYTKTDNAYLLKYGSWLTLKQILYTFFSFFLTLAFANLLPKETYGNYKYILSVAALLAIPTLTGIDLAINRAVSRGFEGSFVKGLKTKISWGILGGLASLGLAGYYYFYHNTDLAISFLIIAAFIPLMDSFDLYNSLLEGKKLFGVQTKYSVFVRFLTVITLIVALFLAQNLFLIIFAYFFSNTLFRLMFFLITLKKFPPNKEKDPQVIAYGKHLTFMGLINILANYLDGILVFHYLGAAELAVYSMAILPPEQLKSFLKSIGSLALPKFSIKTKEEIKINLFQKTFRLVLFIALGIIAYIFLAPAFYHLFFPQYTQSVFYSQIFAVSLIAAAGILPKTALEAQMAKKQLYQFNFYAPILKISLLFIFIFLYGLLGIIVARVIGRLIDLVLASWLAKKI